MKKRAVPFAFAAVLIVVSVLVLVIGNIVEKRTPSKKHASEDDIYKIFKLYDGYTEEKGKVNFDHAKKAEDNQIAILLQNQLVNDRAIVDNNVIYLKYEFVRDQLNSRFYWDNNENILLYTTPTDIIKASVGSQDYYVTKVKNTVNYQIVKTNGNEVYVALDFVKLYTDIDYKFYQKPNRICITNQWNVEKDVATLKEETKIRTDNSIKSDILYDCKKDTKVTVLTKKKEWSEVITEDGFFGYVKTSSLTKKAKESTPSTFVKPEYTSIKKNYTINMGWHMITAASGNSQLVDLVSKTKGLNVISPTWFRLSDNEGGISSLADASYVTKAHLLGLEVWAMIDDQSSESSNKEIFSYTSKREKIINQLIATAIEYNIDGINIDFEYITSDISGDYIEFLRELSVKCRINGIVLSIDDKVPAASNMFYNRKEQGIIADYVIIMGYDEHWGMDSGAGSVASLPWVKQGIEDTLKEIPSSKVINAIPFYTRIWEEDPEGQLVKFSSVDMDTALKTLTTNGVTPAWVDKFGQNYGEYSAGTNTIRIWLEDAASIEEKMKLIKNYNLAGVSAWRLGLENPDIWNTIIKYTN